MKSSSSYSVPYGRTGLDFEIPARFEPDILTLAPSPGVIDPAQAITKALDDLIGDIQWADFTDLRSAAVAINDKTRPVPHKDLLPPLLSKLESLGLSPEQITLIIATGAHTPMTPQEFETIVSKGIIERYPLISHDCDDDENLVHLGETSRGTPVWINKVYMDADLRIVVGNIEPHQFQGYSGGVKSAAIGLAGRATINHNHAMMADHGARLGEYEHNPSRQDVEEIGRMVGVSFALNTILNDSKEIIHVAAGIPVDVMEACIPLAKSVCQAEVSAPYDLVIASAGGHPKDINVYQAQKGLAHATLVTKPGGTVIWVAACPEGAGSRGYESWVKNLTSNQEVLDRFASEGFRVGPHKAFQIARDAARVNVLLKSEMDAGFVRQLLLQPVEDLQAVIDAVISELPASARLCIMPMANATIPLLPNKSNLAEDR